LRAESLKSSVSGKLPNPSRKITAPGKLPPVKKKTVEKVENFKHTNFYIGIL
jgi:hypothetical protein